MAAYLGQKDMYYFLLEKEREEHWVYSDVMCAAYPLEHVDSIAADGTINPTSTLHLIVHGKKVRYLAKFSSV